MTDVTAMEALTDQILPSTTNDRGRVQEERLVDARDSRQHLVGHQQPGSRRSSRLSALSQITPVATSSYPPPAVLVAPPMHYWLVEVVVAHIYVLTGRNLQNVDVVGLSDPYLKVELGGQIVVSERVFDE